jgi:hypothetical protein
MDARIPLSDIPSLHVAIYVLGAFDAIKRWSPTWHRSQLDNLRGYRRFFHRAIYGIIASHSSFSLKFFIRVASPQPVGFAIHLLHWIFFSD